jgi:hypothetical protein
MMPRHRDRAMPTETQKVDWIEIVPGSRSVRKGKRKKKTKRSPSMVYVVTKDSKDTLHFFFDHNDAWLDRLYDAMENNKDVEFDYDEEDTTLLLTRRKQSILSSFTINRVFFRASLV